MGAAATRAAVWASIANDIFATFPYILLHFAASCYILLHRSDYRNRDFVYIKKMINYIVSFFSIMAKGFFLTHGRKFHPAWFPSLKRLPPARRRLASCPP